MDMLRKAYQRAVCIPLDNVESIWQEYNQFENNLNKMTVSNNLLSTLSKKIERAEFNERETSFSGTILTNAFVSTLALSLFK